MGTTEVLTLIRRQLISIMSFAVQLIRFSLDCTQE